MSDIILKKLWERTQNNAQAATPDEWSEQVNVIYKCGKGLEETLRYLYQQRPDFAAFTEWMKAFPVTEVLEVSCEDALDAEDINFFNQNGYVIIKNVLTAAQCEEAKEEILQYLDASLSDPSSWYKDHEEQRGLMLMLYHRPALEVVRKSPRVRKAYEQLYASGNIHGVVDKVSFNPPETAHWKFKGSPLHWDVSLTLPIPFKLQGLLYLNDVEADGGAFHCVPGFHNRIEDWLQNLAPNINPRDAALDQLIAQPVTGKAGDFIIWHQALPHCATANKSNTPRFVQYHTYVPDNLVDQQVWK